eukprot:TRINITY_DN7824_c0_g1_i1.p1 TRINITY_DN7824_c0_g1~~TRINITY_DN7824_c0_g1_i1.p1  ORF type:complete len:264 (+),score=71.21 TRINITY_DN7824_c0_g1_i1:66-857(+)
MADSSRRIFVGCNWKCSLETQAAVTDLIDNINSQWKKDELARVDLCVFPPYVFLDSVRNRLDPSLLVGSQNVWESREPLAGNTGSVTAKMLASVGCSWVLLGHADRRNTLEEGNDLIASKVSKCLEAGLKVNLTIGDTKAVRDAGETDATLVKQLEVATQGVAADGWGSLVVAYEPVWAVGDGAIPCSPEEAQRVLSTLRAWVKAKHGEAAAAAARFVYTGSVNEKNAADYAGLPDCDGFVVGRAGLDATKLVDICTTLCKQR